VHVVHADLSGFNLLYGPDGLVAIDFPQAVDARFNPNALSLLGRDIDNVCRFFSRYGVQANSNALIDDL
jgi:RIO kinase 1